MKKGYQALKGDYASASHSLDLEASERNILTSVPREANRNSNPSIPGKSMAKFNRVSNEVFNKVSNKVSDEVSIANTEEVNPEPLHRSLSGSTLVSYQERVETAVSNENVGKST